MLRAPAMFENQALIRIIHPEDMKETIGKDAVRFTEMLCWREKGHFQN